MNNRSGKKQSNALADRIAGLNDPSMGDERERDVILRAYTFGSVVSIYVFLGLSLLFAVIGAGLWTLPLILGSGLLTFVVSGYCKRAGVDFALATACAAPRRLILTQIVMAVVAFAWVFAVGFHQSTGHPLVEAGLGTTIKSASGSSMMIGGVFGAAAAITVMAVSRYRKLKQARLEAAAAADIADED